MNGFGFSIGPGMARRTGTPGPAPTPTPTPTPTPSAAITSFAVMGATPIDPDGGGVGVDGNGWVARVRVPFASGVTFDPAKIVLTVSDPGYDGAGAVVARSRTIRGRAILRRQYPNNATLLAVQDGSTLDVLIALDDELYAGSTITDAVAEAGYYGAAAAGAIGGPVNGATRAYPKPLFAWLNVPHERATGSGFAVEAVAYHRHAMLGRQVACIQFQARDAQAVPNLSAVQTSAAPTLSDFQTLGQRVEAYKAVVPLAALTQGDLCVMNARVYPWIGDASAVLDLSVDGVAWPTAQPQTTLRFLCDKTGGYGGAVAFVRAGASGGTVSLVEATARAAPFPTINAALAAVQTFNSGRGHTDHSGATIYLMDDGAGGAVTHSASATMAAVAAGKCLTDIRPDPLATGAVTLGTGAAKNYPDLLRTSVDVIVGSATIIDSGTNNNHVLVTENCSVTHASYTSSWAYRKGLRYYRNVTHKGVIANGAALGIGGDGGARGLCPLALGVVIDAGATVPATVGFSSYATIGCAIRKGAFAEFVPGVNLQADPMDGLIFANNRIMEKTTTCRIGTANPATRGIAVVQNLFEAVFGAAAKALELAADSTATPVSNIVVHHNSGVGERVNMAYAETTGSVGVTKRVSRRFNLVEYWNQKSDVDQQLSTATGRVGGWYTGYGVGGLGEVCIRGSQNTFTAPDPTGGSPPQGNWLGMAWPPGSAPAAGAANVSFVNPQGKITGGSGNGDYRLSGASNAAYGRVPAGLSVLAFDLGGQARRTDGSGAAGAYERES
jgi:hypothetical protein